MPLLGQSPASTIVTIATARGSAQAATRNDIATGITWQFISGAAKSSAKPSAAFDQKPEIEAADGGTIESRMTLRMPSGCKRTASC